MSRYISIAITKYKINANKNAAAMPKEIPLITKLEATNLSPLMKAEITETKLTIDKTL